MKKVTKVKKNWLKVQFEKHPYIYSALIGWPILWYILVLIDDNSKVYVEVLLIILFSFPLIIFFLWFRKNKSKAKSFYKRKKKIFNRVYFYLGSVFSLIPIACIVGIIVTGGVSNFIERTKFEINAAVHTFNKYDQCSSVYWSLSGFPKDFKIFILKEQTQYLDYFEDKVVPFDQVDPDFLKFNHCSSTRQLLKEAQGGNEIAKEILVAYPPELRSMYSFPLGTENNKYIFSRYEKNIANMDLDNPAIAYSYAVYLDENISRYTFEDDVEPIKPNALKYLKQSAEDGYFLSMMTWLQIYSVENNFNQNNCATYLQYINTLANNNSLIPYFTLMQGYMGKKNSDFAKTIFKCLNKKTNFSKAFSMIINRPTEGSNSASQLKKSNNFNSSYPAIFYLYGVGDVEQDYAKAYELFSYSEDDDYGIPDQAYLAYMNYMGMGTEQNLNKGKGLTIELAKKIPITKIQKNSWGQTLLCDDVSYNFIISDLLTAGAYWQIENYYKLSKNERDKIKKEHKANEKIDDKVKEEYRDKLGQCILESEHEVSIKFLEDYIFNRVSDFFKNPELVKTLNYLGEPIN